MDEIFPLEGFNAVMRQDGINRYNLAIGGYTQETGEHMQGLNEFLNLAHQNDHSIGKRISMTTLFKQILSDRESFSYIPDAFTEILQVKSSIESFFNDIKKSKEGNMFERALVLISSYQNYDKKAIYVRQTDLNMLSMEIFDSWKTLGELLREFKAESLGDPYIEKTGKKIDKWLGSEEFTLSDIILAITRSGAEKTFEEYIVKLRKAKGQIDIAERNVDSISWELPCNDDSKQKIKAVLDSVQGFFHLYSIFHVSLDLPRDGAFYAEFDDIFDRVSAITPLYNKVRNFLTKNDLSMSKIKLNFKNPTLAMGWDINKEYDNTAIILLRDGKYYLGIMDPKKKKNIKFEEGSGTGQFYQKMMYKLLPGPNKMLPKVFFSAKNIGYYNPSEEITEGYKAEKHKKGDKFDKEFCHKLIDFFKESIQKNEDWRVFDFKFSPTESYNDISEFYKEVEKQGYKMYFVNTPVDVIDGYVERGDLFLFQIYNKDFAEGTKGNKDMHTIYWEAAFSEKNLRDTVVKLNGEAELFYRDKSNIKMYSHRKGEMLVNRTCKDKKTPVPDKIHKELCDYHNKRITPSELSKDAKLYLDKVHAFEAKYDIIKDRRYREDKMYFHVPLTLNFKASGKSNVNQMVVKKFLSDKGSHIIGIDRGERNLLYVSVIDRTGKIVFQDSLNVIDGFDYREKLHQREMERKEAKQSWNSIGKIKDLKEGYLSRVIQKIATMVIEYNAIVILEDLNFGFKRGRFKVEKQIYQKFESMLIDKLNYLVFKGIIDGDVGSVLNAYQLTVPLESFKKLGKQSGILFYVPAAFTSKIDPTTGFIDLFNTSSITNLSKEREFLEHFDSISFSIRDGGVFSFTFDYRNFSKSVTDYRNIWTLYTHGERIRYVRGKGNEKRDPTKAMKDALLSAGIKYDDGRNIKDSIVQSGNNPLINEVFFSFKDTLQMRNTDGEKDYIISPVKNRKGEFFVTDPANRKFPVDADANGAYHIALKGELLMRMIAEDFDPESDKFTMPKMEHKDWFEFMQTREV